MGRGSGSDEGIEIGPRGVLLVGPLFTNSDMRMSTDFGVTLSMIINAGSSRTVVGSE